MIVDNLFLNCVYICGICG